MHTHHTHSCHTICAAQIQHTHRVTNTNTLTHTQSHLCAHTCTHMHTHMHTHEKHHTLHIISKTLQALLETPVSMETNTCFCNSNLLNSYQGLDRLSLESLLNFMTSTLMKSTHRSPKVNKPLSLITKTSPHQEIISSTPGR